MSNIEISGKVQELRELRRMAEDLNAEIKALTDELKGHMDARQVDTLTGDDFKITWKPVTTSRLDSRALKATMPEVAARFTRETTTRRFVLSA